MEEQQELAMNTKLDKQIIKRLLHYAKPYYLAILFSFILLIGIVGVELVRPIIIGRAIDDVINNYNKVYSIVPEDTKNAIRIEEYYIVQGDVSDKKATIVYDENREPKYFLAIDLSREEISQLNEGVSIQGDRNTSEYIDFKERSIEVLPLERAQIRTLRQQDISRLVRIAVIFVVILVAGLFLNYFQTVILNYTGQKIIYNIRNEVFQHVESLSLRFFGSQPIGRLVTRVTNDTETLNEMYTSVIVNSVKSIMMIIGIAIMMLVLNVQLTLYTFIVIPLIIIMTLWFRKASRKVYREVRTKIANINSFLSEHISGMKILQIFGQEERKYKKFDEANASLNRSNIKQLVIFSIFRPSMYVIYVIGLFIVLLVGSRSVIEGTITLGTLVVFVQYISNFFDPIQQLAEQFDIIQSAMASSEKIFNLLDEKVDIVDLEDAVELEEIKGKIEFRNVWFAYVENEWVLRDVSFVVEPGEVAAFVGATGAGKTSILNLIMRYYDIQKGDIFLDGINIRQIKKDALRSSIGQMLQDVFLFTGTINSNIRLGNEEITDEEITEAAIYVNADQFIRKLPNGYNEKVYEGGTTYSAGQRQLLSFARTLAYKPSVLILDEATANIDTETEQLIQDALLKLMEGRTTLVVAHRLSTIQHADKIIVLHKGKIREIGNHQELLSQQGLYYQLYQLQYQEIN